MEGCGDAIAQTYARLGGEKFCSITNDPRSACASRSAEIQAREEIDFPSRLDWEQRRIRRDEYWVGLCWAGQDTGVRPPGHPVACECPRCFSACALSAAESRSILLKSSPWHTLEVPRLQCRCPPDSLAQEPRLILSSLRDSVLPTAGRLVPGGPRPAVETDSAWASMPIPSYAAVVW